MEPKTKVCKICQKRKSIKRFYARKWFKVRTQEWLMSYSTYCYDCNYERMRKKAKKLKLNKLEEKTCTKCKETKPTTEFYFMKCREQFYNLCKICSGKKDAEFRKNHKVDKKEYYAKRKKTNSKKKPPQIKEKKCARCDETFPISNFYYNRNQAIYSSYCRPCNTAYRKEKYGGTDYDKKYNKNNSERIHKRTREWYHKNKDYLKELQNNYILNYPDRYEATVSVRKAVKTGDLNPSSECECCKKKRRTEAHHMDYSQHLNVMWLCRSCHRTFHNGQNEEIVELIKKIWEERNDISN